MGSPLRWGAFRAGAVSLRPSIGAAPFPWGLSPGGVLAPCLSFPGGVLLARATGALTTVDLQIIKDVLHRRRPRRSKEYYS